MQITFRSAQPDDVDVAQHLIYAAGKATVDYVYGTDDHGGIDFIRHSFSRGDGFLGYRNQTVGTVNGEVVVTGTWYGHREYMRWSIATIRHIFEFYPVADALGVMTRLSSMSRIAPPPAKRMAYLASFSVAPAFRRRGIARRYLHWLATQAGEQGFQTLGLDVATDNAAAERLYESFGFTVDKAHFFHKDRTPGPLADTWRMKLRLDTAPKAGGGEET